MDSIFTCGDKLSPTNATRHTIATVTSPRTSRTGPRALQKPAVADSMARSRIARGTAGLILSQMIPLSEHSNAVAVTKPTLAMLGGFSASVVYRIMHRLVESIESLVKGETRDLAAAEAHASKARLAAQSVQSRVQLAASLTALQQQMGAKASPEVLQQELDRILGNLVPLDEGHAHGQ